MLSLIAATTVEREDSDRELLLPPGKGTGFAAAIDGGGKLFRGPVRSVGQMRHMMRTRRAAMPSAKAVSPRSAVAGSGTAASANC